MFGIEVCSGTSVDQRSELCNRSACQAEAELERVKAAKPQGVDTTFHELEARDDELMVKLKARKRGGGGVSIRRPARGPHGRDLKSLGVSLEPIRPARRCRLS